MMIRLTIATAGVLCLAAGGFVSADETPCEERTPTDCAWASVYPFNTIGNIHWPIEDNLIAVGTAFLVSPHCALTNGHCVYKRKAGEYISAEQTFVPGACRTSWGGIKSQLGWRTVAHKRTNNKWADTSYTPKQGVDYGAIQIICPFSEITTFMPLCFGYESNWAQMSGYPTADLPDANRLWDQWIAYGDVIYTANRWVRYDARSTGGASGSPVWNWRTDSLLADVYAINSTHWDDCDGGAPRLVWQNENLIRSWMQWEPSLAERIEEGCVEWQIVFWPDLIEFFNANEKLRLKPDEVRVEKPVAPPPTGPSRRYMQVIERGFYEWAVYDLQPGNPETNHLVQLLAAPGVDLPGIPWVPGMDFNPQAQGWLSADLATALLSGSAGRASPPVTGIEAVEMELGDFVLIEQPLPDDINDQQDPAPDDEGPVEQKPCPGDLNNDGLVNGGDLGMLLAMWGPCTAGKPCPGDFNGDGKVDGGDLGLLLGVFGNCP